MRPDDLPLFQQLVSRAKRFQHGRLTEHQYQLLERAVLRANMPITSPLFGWFYSSRERLRRALDGAGVTLRGSRVRPLHGFSLARTGFQRLGELEDKIRHSIRQ